MRSELILVKIESRELEKFRTIQEIPLKFRLVLTNDSESALTYRFSVLLGELAA